MRHVFTYNHDSLVGFDVARTGVASMYVPLRK